MEVIVLGAGIVGISTALHLQRRGAYVILVDQNEPARGASYGNAGMIHGEAVFPLPFPRALSEIIRFGLNRTPALHYHLRALPGLAPFLLQYWRHSAPARHREIADAYSALTLRSQDAHLDLADVSGARQFIHEGGCYSIFRSGKGEQNTLHDAEQARQHFGVSYALLDQTAYEQREPHIRNVKGAVHWLDSLTVTDPYDVTRAYYDHFIENGGSFIQGSARQLSGTPNGWCLNGEEKATAEHAVVALGARSVQFTQSLGYRFPLKPKRGYHLHYRAQGNAVLNSTIIDREDGFSMAPMSKGIRLTTGIEFANLDAPPSPVQLKRTEKSAQEVFPLGEASDDPMWMGERPCLPDMLPIIGKAADRDNLWFAFGHGHQGFTMGPVTGRLMAEMMSGDTPVVDPHPYRPERFT